MPYISFGITLDLFRSYGSLRIYLLLKIRVV